MKVRPDTKNGTVCLVLTAHEAIAYASQLVKCAMASGALEGNHRQDSMEEKVEEREP